MSARIIMPKDDGKPVSMADLIKQARDGWSLGKKTEAFQAAMTGLELCSQGIARLMMDMEKIVKHMNEEKK
jgi:hypothetical protein